MLYSPGRQTAEFLFRLNIFTDFYSVIFCTCLTLSDFVGIARTQTKQQMQQPQIRIFHVFAGKYDFGDDFAPLELPELVPKQYRYFFGTSSGIFRGAIPSFSFPSKTSKIFISGSYIYFLVYLYPLQPHIISVRFL